MANNNQQNTISRRKALQILGGTAAPATIAGCLGDNEEQTEPEETTTEENEEDRDSEQQGDQEEEGIDEILDEVEPEDVANEDGLIDINYLQNEHLERAEKLNAYTVTVYNQTNVEQGVLHLQGDIKVDGDQIYAQLGIFDNLTNDIEDRTNFEVFCDGNDEIFVRDETEGTTDYRNPDQDQETIATELIDQESTKLLLTSSSIFPYEDLQKLISEGNAPFQQTETAQTRTMPEKTVHQFSHDSIDLLEDDGVLEDIVEEHGYLEELSVKVIQENGLIANAVFEYINKWEDGGETPQRYKAGLNSLDDSYEDLEPDWLNEAEVATR